MSDVHVPGLESLIANLDSTTKAELLLSYSRQERHTIIEVQTFHVGALAWTNQRTDDDNDVVTWGPEVRLGAFSGVGIAISLDTPHGTVLRLLRKSLEMVDSCSPEKWQAICEEIKKADSPAQERLEIDDDLPF